MEEGEESQERELEELRLEQRMKTERDSYDAGAWDPPMTLRQDCAEEETKGR